MEFWQNLEKKPTQIMIFLPHYMYFPWAEKYNCKNGKPNIVRQKNKKATSIRSNVSQESVNLF